MLKRSKNLHYISFFTAVISILAALGLTLVEIYLWRSEATYDNSALFWLMGFLFLLLLFLLAYHSKIRSEFLRCDEAILKNKKYISRLSLQNRLFGHVEQVSCIGYYTRVIESGQVAYSDNLFRILGYEPMEVTATKELLVSHIKEDERDTVLNWLDYSSSEDFPEEVQVELKNTADECKFIRFSRKLFVEDEHLVLLVTLKDITKEANVNKDLENKNRELLDKNIELDSFNHMAGHDLKEPIRKVQTLLSMVHRFPGLYLPDEVTDYFNRINRSVERMNNLITDLLQFSRVSKDSSVFDNHSLQHIVAAVLVDLEFKINSSKATIQVANLPKAKIIATQMTQLFTNLVENALKFKSEDRDPVIRIAREEVSEVDYSLFPHADRNSLLKLTVSDNGIGFDDQLSETIFLIFNRLHDRRLYPGSGVGLAICKKIVERHGGIIYANAVLNKGATITLILPILEKVAVI